MENRRGVTPVNPESPTEVKMNALARMMKWLRPKSVAEADQQMTNRLDAAKKKLLEQIAEDQKE